MADEQMVSVARVMEVFCLAYIDPALWEEGAYNGAAMQIEEIAGALRYYLLFRASNSALTPETAGAWLGDFIEQDGRMETWAADHVAARERIVEWLIGQPQPQ